MPNKRVLVTGGAGFIGSHLTDKLVDMKCQVTVVDDLSFGKSENINPKAHFVKSDVTDFANLKQIISDTKPETIFHLAAIATTKESAMGWTDPVTDYQINAIGTLNVLRSVVDIGISPIVVYTSSAAVYGEPDYIPINETHPTNPKSPYGISKLAGEKYLFAFATEHKVKGVALRIFNTYGPRQPRYVMYDLYMKLKNNPLKLEVIGTGDQIRDYCYVSDTVKSFILVAEKKEAYGNVFNIAGGNCISIKDLAYAIVELQGLKNKTEISFTGQSWKGDIVKLVADTTKISGLSFKPEVMLAQGLSLLKNWIEKNSANNSSTVS